MFLGVQFCTTAVILRSQAPWDGGSLQAPDVDRLFYEFALDQSERLYS